MSALLEVRAVSKSFRGLRAVHDASFEIPEGDIVFHYDARAQAVVAASKAEGTPHEDSVVWAARGSYARNAGVQPHERFRGVDVSLRARPPVNTD